MCTGNDCMTVSFALIYNKKEDNFLSLHDLLLNLHT